MFVFSNTQLSTIIKTSSVIRYLKVISSREENHDIVDIVVIED
jgi:hypothetical protein